MHQVVFGPGTNGLYNGLDYVEIATTGNAASFGDMDVGNMYGSAHSCSSGHGGLS